MATDAIRHYIGRRVVLSYCNGQRAAANGELSDFSEILIGDFSPERATRKLRKALCDSTITIFNVETKSDYYRMPLWDFIRQAETIQEG